MIDPQSVRVSDEDPLLSFPSASNDIQLIASHLEAFTNWTTAQLNARQYDTLRSCPSFARSYPGKDGIDMNWDKQEAISKEHTEYHTVLVHQETIVDLDNGKAEVFVTAETTGRGDGVVLHSTTVMDFEVRRSIGRWVCVKATPIRGLSGPMD